MRRETTKPDGKQRRIVVYLAGLQAKVNALLKTKDPGFGVLVRVMNWRHEFLWTHEKFASEY